MSQAPPLSPWKETIDSHKLEIDYGRFMFQKNDYISKHKELRTGATLSSSVRRCCSDYCWEIDSYLYTSTEKAFYHQASISRDVSTDSRMGRGERGGGIDA